jgi:hypothetical protein
MRDHLEAKDNKMAKHANTLWDGANDSSVTAVTAPIDVRLSVVSKLL